MNLTGVLEASYNRPGRTFYPPVPGHIYSLPDSVNYNKHLVQQNHDQGKIAL